MLNLKYRRQVKEMSLRDLQIKSGVGHNYICLAENKRYIPSERQLLRIATALEWEGAPQELLEEYKED